MVSNTGYKINTINMKNAGAIKIKALIVESFVSFFLKKSNK